MPSLLDRLTANLTSNEAFEYIDMDVFIAAVNEFKRGELSAANFNSIFNLDAGQTTHALVLRDLIVAAPNADQFTRVLKDILILSRTTMATQYRDIAYVQTRLQNEVLAQGGTLP